MGLFVISNLFLQVASLTGASRTKRMTPGLVEKWPQAKVPYKVASDFSWGPQLSSAMNEIHQNTCIQFIETDEANIASLGLGHDTLLSINSAGSGCGAQQGRLGGH